MAIVTKRIGNKPKKFTIAVGDTLIIMFPRAVGGYYQSFGGASITARPGGGGTLDVEFSTSPFEDIEGGTAVWLDWPSGVVSSNISDSLNGPITGLRLIPAIANATIEVVP